MSDTARDILEKEQISIFAGPRRLTAEEFRAHKAISTQIVQLTLYQLRASFDVWQEFHRQYDEPFIGHLVHEHADIGTAFDAWFDMAIAAPDVLDEPQTAEAERAVADGADFIKSNPTQSSESINIGKLARLVCSFVIEHEPNEREIERTRQELIGDPRHHDYLLRNEDLEEAASLVVTFDAAKQIAAEARDYGFVFEEKNGH